MKRIGFFSSFDCRSPSKFYAVRAALADTQRIACGGSIRAAREAVFQQQG